MPSRRQRRLLELVPGGGFITKRRQQGGKLMTSKRLERIDDISFETLSSEADRPVCCMKRKCFENLSDPRYFL